MDRLKEIKEALSMDNGHLEKIEWRKDVEWLIEQAEKVKKYEKAIETEVKGVTKILIKKLVEED